MPLVENRSALQRDDLAACSIQRPARHHCWLLVMLTPYTIPSITAPDVKIAGSKLKVELCESVIAVARFEKLVPVGPTHFR